MGSKEVLYMIEKIALTKVGNELAAVAAQLRSITVRVRSGNLGIGAGTIWQSDGSILTNAHVATRVRSIVELADGRLFPAIRTHFDPQQDLAILKIAATNLPTAALGNVERLRVGELVMAVGNPFSDPGAVTTGTIYATQPRSIVADIQLYPGNSGGPLADCLGRVVGINTMIVNGLAVAIPIANISEFWHRSENTPGVVG
jgi:serine protease Do